MIINGQNLLADSADEEQLIPKRKYQGLPVLSDTRWLTRIDSIDCLLKHYRAVCEAVEEVRDSSCGQSASDADAFLKRLLSFEFLASAVICRHVLAYTRPITVALQASNCDLLKAHRMAQRLVKTLEIERTEADKFKDLWQNITEIAASLNMEPTKKRTVARQQNRANPPVEETEAHYRVAYFYAFLDHTINHLKTRFPKELEGTLLATYLLPSKVEFLSDEKVIKIKEEFQSVLPHPSEFENEVSTWKVHVAETEPDDGDDRNRIWCLLVPSLRRTVRTIQIYTPFYYYFLPFLLGPALVNDSLRRRCRNSMSDDRLDSLAIGFINPERTPPPKKVLEVWDRAGHRRIATAFR